MFCCRRFISDKLVLITLNIFKILKIKPKLIILNNLKPLICFTKLNFGNNKKVEKLNASTDNIKECRQLSRLHHTFISAHIYKWFYTYPTANHSPVGQYPSENICEVKSCCCSCFPCLKSQRRTVLSRPPVHNLLPSGEISIQLAPSVWPWNCLPTKVKSDIRVFWITKNNCTVWI